MADDHDALLARAERWDNEGLGEFITDLAAALRESQANYHAALDIIARLTEGWDARSTHDDLPPDHAWFRDPVLAAPDEDTGPHPMSDRQWAVYTHAAQRATHGDHQ